MSLGVMLTGLLLAGDGTHWGTPPAARGTGVPQDSVGAPDSRPPAAWLVNDPADSLYRAAREALDRRDYQKAADLFAQVPVRRDRLDRKSTRLNSSHSSNSYAVFCLKTKNFDLDVTTIRTPN